MKKNGVEEQIPHAAKRSDGGRKEQKRKAARTSGGLFDACRSGYDSS